MAAAARPVRLLLREDGAEKLRVGLCAHDLVVRYLWMSRFVEAKSSSVNITYARTRLQDPLHAVAGSIAGDCRRNSHAVTGLSPWASVSGLWDPAEPRNYAGCDTSDAAFDTLLLNSRTSTTEVVLLLTYLLGRT